MERFSSGTKVFSLFCLFFSKKKKKKKKKKRNANFEGFLLPFPKREKEKPFGSPSIFEKNGSIFILKEILLFSFRSRL
jgi:hypothetical protein